MIKKKLCRYARWKKKGMISGKGGLLQRSPAPRGQKREKKWKWEKRREKRENVVPVQKPTNEGRAYPERCIQVKRGKRNRLREKERWNLRWIKENSDRGKVRDRDKERPYIRWEIRKLRPSRLKLNLNAGFVEKGKLWNFLHLLFVEIFEFKNIVKSFKKIILMQRSFNEKILWKSSYFSHIFSIFILLHLMIPIILKNCSSVPTTL